MKCRISTVCWRCCMATVNKQAIAAAFGRAAALYEQHADLQRQSADVLLAMLPQRKYTHVLDAGCGPGWMSRHWRERHAQVTALDLSPPMLVQARQKDAADHKASADAQEAVASCVETIISAAPAEFQGLGMLEYLRQCREHIVEKVRREHRHHKTRQRYPARIFP